MTTPWLTRNINEKSVRQTVNLKSINKIFTSKHLQKLHIALVFQEPL